MLGCSLRNWTLTVNGHSLCSETDDLKFKQIEGLSFFVANNISIEKWIVCIVRLIKAALIYQFLFYHAALLDSHLMLVNTCSPVLDKSAFNFDKLKKACNNNRAFFTILQATWI
jgi:hypothetical protein